jgi:hypothetical protein
MSANKQMAEKRDHFGLMYSTSWNFGMALAQKEGSESSEGELFRIAMDRTGS